MKKRLFGFVLASLIMACLMITSALALTYEPDSDGRYTVQLDMQPGNMYSIVVIEGTYDQTNYIEVYNAIEDNKILYADQKSSDESGMVTFGPFVPMYYSDATVLVGGTDLDEMMLAGHLSADGISNCASVAVSELENSYTVTGVDGEDVVLTPEIQVLDSFGYPSLLEYDVAVTLESTASDVFVENNVITISKTAKEQLVEIKISAGEAEKTVYVNVQRQQSTPSYIEVYTDASCLLPLDEISVLGVAGSYCEITVYAKTFDSYCEPVSDTFTFTYAGNACESTFDVLEGENVLVVTGESGVVREITVKTETRPDYQGSALSLYELVLECEELISQEKIISADGKDVFPDSKWITSAAVEAFRTAIDTAITALSMYGQTGYTSADYTDELTTLTKAKTTYNNAFKAGTRVDVSSISFADEEIVVYKNYSPTVQISVTTSPAIALTNDVITWASSDESVATVTAGSVKGKASVSAVGNGTAYVTATTRSGLSATLKVSVVTVAMSLELSGTSGSTVTMTYGSEDNKLYAKAGPADTNDEIELVYDESLMSAVQTDSYVEGAFRIYEFTVTPVSDGTDSVKAVAKHSGITSAVCKVTTVMPDWETVSAPTASVESGSVISGTEVALSSLTENAVIYYTLDGTTPSRTNGRIYKSPIAVGQSLKLRAIAVADGYYDSTVSEYDYEVAYFVVGVESTSARSGEAVSVSVNALQLENIKSASVTVLFDGSVLLPAKLVEKCDYIDTDSIYSDDNSFSFRIYNNGEAITYLGELAELCFEVPATAQSGIYTLSLQVSDVKDADGNDVVTACVDGGMEISKFLLGDADNDGKIGLADVLIIKQYAAGKSAAAEKIVLDAADVDGDGDVDNDDAVLVSKYCVGYPVTFTAAEKQTLFEDVRIVSNYEIDNDENGAWRYLYDVYNPSAGTKDTYVASANSNEKASSLGTPNPAGSLIKLYDGMVDENEGVLGVVTNESNLVWIADVDTSEGFVQVVPYDSAYVDVFTDSNGDGADDGVDEVVEYVENYDFDNAGAKPYGITKTAAGSMGFAELKSNFIDFDNDTVVAVVTYSGEFTSENFWKAATIKLSTMEDVAAKKKALLAYKSDAVDKNGNLVTKYSDFVKAYVAVDDTDFVEGTHNATAEFVLVIVNDGENAAKDKLDI